eukprot:COSAG01_NODE_2306_length_7946_cov_4.903148_10_plen_67_part_00
MGLVAPSGAPGRHARPGHLGEIEESLASGAGSCCSSRPRLDLDYTAVQYSLYSLFGCWVLFSQNAK